LPQSESLQAQRFARQARRKAERGTSARLRLLRQRLAQHFLEQRRWNVCRRQCSSKPARRRGRGVCIRRSALVHRCCLNRPCCVRLAHCANAHCRRGSQVERKRRSSLGHSHLARRRPREHTRACTGWRTTAARRYRRYRLPRSAVSERARNAQHATHRGEPREAALPHGAGSMECSASPRRVRTPIRTGARASVRPRQQRARRHRLRTVLPS